MNFEVFDIKTKDGFDRFYPIISKWWEEWKMPALDIRFLPDNGIMVKDGDRFMCAGWFYRTEVPICLMGHYISSQEKEGRAEAMEFLIKSLEKRVKELGFELISTFVRNPNLISTLEKQGYGDFKETGQINFVKRI